MCWKFQINLWSVSDILLKCRPTVMVSAMSFSDLKTYFPATPLCTFAYPSSCCSLFPALFKLTLILCQIIKSLVAVDVQHSCHSSLGLPCLDHIPVFWISDLPAPWLLPNRTSDHGVNLPFWIYRDASRILLLKLLLDRRLPVNDHLLSLLYAWLSPLETSLDYVPLQPALLLQTCLLQWCHPAQLPQEALTISA